MSSSLVIILAKRSSFYCVIDVVPHTNSNSVSWNEKDRYKALGNASNISSIWHRDKARLKQWIPIEKERFEALYGKVEYP